MSLEKDKVLQVLSKLDLFFMTIHMLLGTNSLCFLLNIKSMVFFKPITDVGSMVNQARMYVSGNDQ